MLFRREQPNAKCFGMHLAAFSLNELPPLNVRLRYAGSALRGRCSLLPGTFCVSSRTVPYTVMIGEEYGFLLSRFTGLALRTSARKLYRTLRADCNQKLRQSGRRVGLSMLRVRFTSKRRNAGSVNVRAPSPRSMSTDPSIRLAICLKCSTKGLPARGVLRRVRTLSG